MSEARMKPPAPVRMWAVVGHLTGGRAEFVYESTIRRTRREAIDAYEGGWDGEYARQRSRGEVRVARVLVSMEGEG